MWANSDGFYMVGTQLNKMYENLVRFRLLRDVYTSYTRKAIEYVQR